MADTMQAVVFHGKGDIRIEQVNVPKPGPKDVQLKPAFVGICGTDLHEYLEGAYLIPTTPHPVTGKSAPVIIGHEYSGVVSDVGSEIDDLKPGDRVVVQPIIFDGTCNSCQRGLINCCNNSGFIGLSGIGGGLATYTTVPRYSVFKIPDNIPLKVAAVAWSAVTQSDFKPGDTALILGAGPIGLAILQVLKSKGASQIIVSETTKKRREFATTFGATTVLDPTKTNVGEECKKFCEGEGVQVVFDCAGMQSTLETALAASRPRSVIVNVAIWATEVTISPNYFMLNERTFKGSATYTASVFQEVIDALARGDLNPEPMITSLIEMDEIEEKGFKALINYKDTQVKILLLIVHILTVTAQVTVQHESPSTMAFTPQLLPDLSGQVYIVTGGNAGIGFNTVLELAAHKAKVYMGARSEAKANAAIDEIKSQYPDADISVLVMDMMNLKTVKAAADEFARKESRLHGLVNNAGIMATPYEESGDCYEAQFQTNYLSHWLLTYSLLPILTQSAQSTSPGTVRVVNVSSDGHLVFSPSAGIDFDDINQIKGSAFSRYGMSKLANILHAKELHRRYGPSPQNEGQEEIWTASLHPGTIDTLYSPLETAAYTSLFAIAGPDFSRDMSGEYLKPVGIIGKTAATAQDPKLAKELWDWTENEMRTKGFIN
ncbi:alcohol sorbitol dehydrogenase [Fusarium sp. NRRL 52700]|nr:alcohol sorbitol dehydrogenase [Fusarium sp. NRRL 52700]